MISIWVATLAVKQKSRTVHFKRAAQLLEFLQLPKDGIHYRRLIQGFMRGSLYLAHRGCRINSVPQPIPGTSASGKRSANGWKGSSSSGPTVPQNYAEMVNSWSLIARLNLPRSATGSIKKKFNQITARADVSTIDLAEMIEDLRGDLAAATSRSNGPGNLGRYWTKT